MDKASTAIAKLMVVCVLPSVFYPRPLDLTSQDEATPLNNRGGGPPNTDLPYLVAYRPISQSNTEMAALFSPKRYEPLIADVPRIFPLPPEHGARARKSETTHEARVLIQIDQTRQRLSVHMGGEAVQGLESIRVSTGRPGKVTRTPDGIYSPGTMAVRRQSYFASRLKKRPVYLTHAIQIVEGIFMHDASHGAMEHIGKKRSLGCVRVDRRWMPKIFRLVKQHRADTRIRIFHSSETDPSGRDLAADSDSRRRTVR